MGERKLCSGLEEGWRELLSMVGGMEVVMHGRQFIMLVVPTTMCVEDVAVPVVFFDFTY